MGSISKRLFVSTLGLGMATGLAGCRQQKGPDSAESQINVLQGLKQTVHQKADALTGTMLLTNATEQYHEAIYLRGLNDGLCEKAKLRCINPVEDITFNSVMMALVKNADNAIQLSSPNDNPQLLEQRRLAVLDLVETLDDQTQRHSSAESRLAGPG